MARNLHDDYNFWLVLLNLSVFKVKFSVRSTVDVPWFKLSTFSMQPLPLSCELGSISLFSSSMFVSLFRAMFRTSLLANNILFELNAAASYILLLSWLRVHDQSSNKGHVSMTGPQSCTLARYDWGWAWRLHNYISSDCWFDGLILAN